MLDQWAYLNGVKIDFTRPGKPTDNAYIEAFSARLRAECLNASWFPSMAGASDRIRLKGEGYLPQQPSESAGGYVLRNHSTLFVLRAGAILMLSRLQKPPTRNLHRRRDSFSQGWI